MIYNIDDVIKFKNGEYLVLDIIKYKENTYLYLINNSEYENDTSIVKVIFENNQMKYKSVENEEIFEYIINKIFVNFKEDITTLINNKK